MLVAAGVPEAMDLRESAVIIARCAVAMQNKMRQFAHKIGPSKLKRNKLQSRIGIHCGKVLAGVIGDHMPRYQLFGLAVDEVQALESSAEPGTVHASAEILRQLQLPPLTKPVAPRPQPAVHPFATVVGWMLGANSLPTPAASSTELPGAQDTSVMSPAPATTPLDRPVTISAVSQPAAASAVPATVPAFPPPSPSPMSKAQRYRAGSAASMSQQIITGARPIQPLRSRHSLRGTGILGTGVSGLNLLGLGSRETNSNARPSFYRGPQSPSPPAVKITPLLASPDIGMVGLPLPDGSCVLDSTARPTSTALKRQ
jgi:hypothetical protein